MSTSNNPTYNSNNDKWCSHCHKFKLVTEFIIHSGSDIKTFDTCNNYKSSDTIDDRNISSILPNVEMPTDTSNSESSEDDLIYDINDLEEFISIKFRECEELSTNVEFLVIVEIEKEMVDNESLSLEP
ncbi:1598_t:CDS:2, partial [Cetraspora pellucida]